MSVQPATTSDFDHPITPDQRKALFAAAKVRGMDIDDLRAMTPLGSISALTIRQAAELLDRVNAGTKYERPRRPRPPRRAKGVYALPTATQRAKIEGIREALGWTKEGLAEFLTGRRYEHGGPMSEMLTSRDARDVIQLLNRVLAGTQTARARRGQRNESSGGDGVSNGGNRADPAGDTPPADGSDKPTSTGV